MGEEQKKLKKREKEEQQLAKKREKEAQRRERQTKKAGTNSEKVPLLGIGHESDGTVVGVQPVYGNQIRRRLENDSNTFQLSFLFGVLMMLFLGMFFVFARRFRAKSARTIDPEERDIE